MFEKTTIRHSKKRLMVRLCLNGGREVEGEVFVAPEERLVDLLNDARAFVPLETAEGEVMSVAKTAIESAQLIQEAPSEARDPYALLRIERTAPDDEIRRAWMNRLKACHPDRLAALNLDEEVVYAARKTAQRINAAYDEVMRHRRGGAAA
ncbi:J domain-containing protein [Parvularcula oceani]|uniref:J domain-containing protein n=1 Tax=Parvularcula oceani TaxID=1247963 RepID=UPI0004E10B78|nr:DnaJ domain-containing protein [Parvularcula oceani]